MVRGRCDTNAARFWGEGHCPRPVVPQAARPFGEGSALGLVLALALARVVCCSAMTAGASVTSQRTKWRSRWRVGLARRRLRRGDVFATGVVIGHENTVPPTEPVIVRCASRGGEPGHGESGPTLEIYSYSEMAGKPSSMANRKGLGHLAFAVDDVAAIVALPSVTEARTIAALYMAREWLRTHG